MISVSTATKGTASLFFLAAVSGCATTGGEPLTTQQKMVRCAGMVAGGALLGALVGNNVGGGSAGDGAALGAVVGGVSCGVWLAFENEADKRRLAEAQLAAAQRGEVINTSWTGEDGRVRQLSVTPSTETQMVPVTSGEGGESAPQVCRTMNTTASVGANSDTFSEVWCRDSNGNWSASESAMMST